jgi:SAM-dependent MidA family methyltransferase
MRVNRLLPLIQEEIARNGPMRFSRFMELCLYHPEHGYYRRDPFGQHGDFYTAEQIQPVFGRLIAAYVRRIAPDARVVVEIGAGRREMAESFAGYDYVPVDVAYGAVPHGFSGVVFSNEFFDAIPVDIVVRRDNAWFERRVGRNLEWDETTRWHGVIEEDVHLRELQNQRVEWLRQIAGSLQRGVVITIDYGYTRRELIRFPEGTLMSYRRHLASAEVLRDPGERDLTAHVDFTALQEEGERVGLRTLRFESLASALLYAGEADNFASVLAGLAGIDEQKRRLQLKSLLFGMGETFRVLVQER